MNKLSRDQLRAKYAFVGPFMDERARARDKGREFHILENGEPAYPEKYDWVGPYVGGYAYVGNGKPGRTAEWFRVDKNGVVAEKGTCEKWSFCLHGVIIKIGGQVCLNNRIIFEGSFDDWEITGEGLIIKKGGAKIYLVTYEGGTVTPL